jgi:RNA polymerase sigma factor (sigma-70 family)
MKAIDADDVSLVVAAQRGERRALDELVSRHLPLLYNVVGRALDGHADVDDVVQETLIRVVRDLPALRAPERFRSWLLAIAVRQISGHRQSRKVTSQRMTAIDEAGPLPDQTALENEAVLRLHLSDQRSQVMEASRWLDRDYRTLLSLWLQEVAGLLSRADVAGAAKTSVAHVGVRLQRMREQLELARTIVAALNARSRCPEMESVIAGWDGTPSPLWRKRIARHTRECHQCGYSAAGAVPAERLLPGIVALPVPAGLAAALTAKGFPPPPAAPWQPAVHVPALAGKAGNRAAGTLIGRLAHAAAAHPLVSVGSGVVAAAVGGAVTVAVIPHAARPVPAAMPPPAVVASAPAVVASATAAVPGPARTRQATAKPASPVAVPPGKVPLGTWSLESVAKPGQYLTTAGGFAALAAVSGSSPAPVRQQATFTVVRGLADGNCVSFRAANGDYLRHYELRLQLSPVASGGPLLPVAATFCPRPGAVPGSVTLRSFNYPALVIRYRAGGIYIQVPDGTQAFAAESSFVVGSPLG